MKLVEIIRAWSMGNETITINLRLFYSEKLSKNNL